MSTAAAVRQRHPLGLPAGSVRAILSFAVLGLLWGILVATPESRQLPLVFFYLQVLMVLVLACFFAAHGKTIGHQVDTRSPLGLPSRTVRFLLLAGYVGLVAHLWHTSREFETPPKGDFAFLSMVLLSGFFLGHVANGAVRMISLGKIPFWFQDVQAWLSLVAMIGLAIIAIVHLLINPRLGEEMKLDVPTLEAVLSGLVGLYFGARA